MLRLILAVVLGCLVFAALVMGLLTGAYLVMGSERAFLPDSYDVSPSWVGLSLVVGFLAAWVGGWVAARVGRGRGATLGLAGLVLLAGVVVAVMETRHTPSETPLVRDRALSNTEAMRQAQQPPWIAWVNPLIGVAGVLVGGRRRKR